MKSFILKNMRSIIFLVTIIIHLLVFFTFKIVVDAKQKREDNTIFKMVDVREMIPPDPVKEEKKEEIIKDEVVVDVQDAVVEDVIITEDKVIEESIDYLDQFKISDIPVIPHKEINSKIIYPPLANKQGITGVVYLELYIDQRGVVRDVKVLKDPGYGFAEAAVNAFKGVICIPARQNGVAVAVKFRCPVRFELK